MVRCYYENEQNAAAAARAYAEEFPRRAHPSSQVILRVINRMFDTGTLLPKREGGLQGRRIRPQVEEDILETFSRDPSTSSRIVGRDFGVSHKTVLRILHEDGQKPFHLTKVQKLYPGDKDRRLDFCNLLLEHARQEENFLSRILWSDECIFTNAGYFNIHNCHVWSHENPLQVIETANQYKFSLHMWAGLLDNQLVSRKSLFY